jgi:transcription antitermination factor NusG
MARAEHWYALTTKPRSEQAACARAEHFGFKTHVPMCEKSVIANRHTKKRKLKKFPILPGVIFVGADKEITPRVLMALIEPVRPEILLGHGDCPNRIDRSTWAKLAKSKRNRKLSPITGVIGTGDVPGLISYQAIKQMADRNGQAEDLALQMARGEIDIYDPGAEIRILEGPFEGFSGLVEEARGARAKVFVSVFGRETPLEIGIEHIEAA